MRDNYKSALTHVLVHEGGWSNHPRDPGGATMYGVTQRVYDAYRRRKLLPEQSVRQISRAELEAIYRTQYADKVRFDDLPYGVDYVVFDGAVNSGPAQSVKWLQRALGVAVDGVIGNATLQAAKEYPDQDGLIRKILDRRKAFLRALSTWDTFGRGWTARVDQARKVAVAMNDNVPAPPSFFVAGMSAKATVADAGMPAAPVATPTAGAGAGGVGVAIETVRQQIEPYAAMSETLNRILIGLVALSFIIAVGTFAYGFYARWKRDRVAAKLDLDTDVQVNADPVSAEIDEVIPPPGPDEEEPAHAV
jgi:lysozyme family protein